MTDYCNEFIKLMRSDIGERSPIIPEMILNDGSRLSIQASPFHYCTPRSFSKKYKRIEVLFDNENIAARLIFDKYLNEDFGACSYVPVTLVNEYIELSGGIDYEKSKEYDRSYFREFTDA